MKPNDLPRPTLAFFLPPHSIDPRRIVPEPTESSAQMIRQAPTTQTYPCGLRCQVIEYVKQRIFRNRLAITGRPLNRIARNELQSCCFNNAMTHESARKQATSLVRISSDRPDSEPVDDTTWADLVEVAMWAKYHAPYPGLVEAAIPSYDSQRTWLKVRHGAEAVLASFGRGQ
jgi:hypothetical protein